MVAERRWTEIGKSSRGVRKMMPTKIRFVPSTAEIRGCQPAARFVGCRRVMVNHPSKARKERTHDLENSRARSRPSSATKLFIAKRLCAVATASTKNQRLTVNRTVRSQVTMVHISACHKCRDDKHQKET